MKAKNLCVVMLTLALTIASISPCTVYAGKSNDVIIDTSENNKSSEDERKQREKQMEEAAEKWSKLTDEQKKQVYQLLEEEKAVNDKLLDQLVSLGVLDQSVAMEMKNKMAEGLSKMNEDGEFPLGRKCPKKEKSAEGNKNNN